MLRDGVLIRKSHALGVCVVIVSSIISSNIVVVILIIMITKFNLSNWGGLLHGIAGAATIHTAYDSATTT